MAAPGISSSRGIVTIFCATFAAFHVYVAFDPFVSTLERNAIHFAGFALIAGLTYGTKPRRFLPRRPARVFDVLFASLAALAAVFLAFQETSIYARALELSPIETGAALLCIMAAIVLTRRTSGLVIPCLILLSLTYIGYWGKLLPGVLSFPGLSWETVLFRSIFGDDALFGTVASISATYVFLYIIFGAFLLRSGAGDFVVVVARALAGRTKGGAGFVAILASALTATISGSAVANTVSTGVITIPMMKRSGFSPTFASAVEASASTGGQLMPPIMGAGAFVMASFTQIPYETIVKVAILPAILYFFSVAVFVRIEAVRANLSQTETDAPRLGEAFASGGASFVVSIALLVTMLLQGFTPVFSAVAAIVAVIAASWLGRKPMGVRAIIEALESGTKSMAVTAVLLCAIGLVVNVIATAGIGNTFSLMIATWSGGHLIIAILLVALASLVLGMGLPVTAAYIVLATLSAPALSGLMADRFIIDALVEGTTSEGARALLSLAVDEPSLLASPLAPEAANALVRGLPIDLALPLRDLVVPKETALAALLAAHMIVFWLSQDSNVTPPVALAAFAASAIGKAPSMATAFTSWRLAKGLYIVPFLIAYTPLLSGDWLEALRVFLFALVGIYALAGALQACLEGPISSAERLLLLLFGSLCLAPVAMPWKLAGLVLTLAITLRSRRGASGAA